MSKFIAITSLFLLIFASACAKQTNPIEPQESKVPTIHQGGMASVYSDKLQGKKTAAGDIFSQDKLTAASKTFALGSRVKVTNKKTGKSAIVTITDRGPFVKGRSIDLSKSAAEKIGMPLDGLTDVQIQKVD